MFFGKSIPMIHTVPHAFQFYFQIQIEFFGFFYLEPLKLKLCSQNLISTLSILSVKEGIKLEHEWMKIKVNTFILTIFLVHTFVCCLKIYKKLNNMKNEIYILTLHIKTFFRLKLHISLPILQLLVPYSDNRWRGII